MQIMGDLEKCTSLLFSLSRKMFIERSDIGLAKVWLLLELSADKVVWQIWTLSYYIPKKRKKEKTQKEEQKITI